MAQPYPARPVTLIVPYGAGGPLDTLTRIVSERMRVSLGQPMVIENVTGASGTVGVGRAVRAAPDGYTVSVGNWPTHVVNGATFAAIRCAAGFRSGRPAVEQSLCGRGEKGPAGEGFERADCLPQS